MVLGLDLSQDGNYVLRGSILKRTAREQASQDTKAEATRLLLTSEVTSRYFHHILLITSKSLRSAQIKGKRNWTPLDGTAVRSHCRRAGEMVNIVASLENVKSHNGYEMIDQAQEENS